MGPSTFDFNQARSWLEERGVKDSGVRDAYFRCWNAIEYGMALAREEQQEGEDLERRSAQARR